VLPASRKKKKKRQRHSEIELLQKTTEKKMKENQPFAKLKEVFLQRTNQRSNTTFNFAQRAQSPPTTRIRN
jgi:hypothetical protein